MRRHRLATTVSIGALVLGVLAPATAHDLFLRPDRLPRPGDRHATIRAVLGFNFPEGTFLPREHLKLWTRADDGRTVELPSTPDGTTRKALCPLPGDGGSLVYADYTGYLTRTENGNEFLPR
jgi:hypothetical protein